MNYPFVDSNIYISINVIYYLLWFIRSGGIKKENLRKQAHDKGAQQQRPVKWENIWQGNDAAWARSWILHATHVHRACCALLSRGEGFANWLIDSSLRPIRSATAINSVAVSLLRALCWRLLLDKKKLFFDDGEQKSPSGAMVVITIFAEIYCCYYKQFLTWKGALLWAATWRWKIM